MKIENKIFKDFMLKRVDTSPNSEATTLQSTPEGNIKMEAVEPTQVLMSSHVMSKLAISNITQFKDLSINNMTRLDKVIKTIPDKGQLDVIINDATIQLGTDKETHVLCLVDKEMATESIIPDITFSTFFKLKLNYIKDIKKIIGTFNDPIAIIFTYENKKLSYAIEEDGEITTSKPIPVMTNSVDGKQILKVSVGYFTRIIDLLTEDITFYIKSDYPLQIKETVGTFINSTYILAPRVDNDEQGKPEDIIDKTEQTGDTSE